MRGPGDRYGCHRALIPTGGFPQSAQKLDSSLPLYDNEILIAVERLNIDAASFQQMKGEAGGSAEGIRQQIIETVKRRGKMHNPVTDSGGMLLGTVREIGPFARNRGFQPSERIATLVSLTLTPLHLSAVDEVDLEREQVRVKGHAILFESAPAHRLPSDFQEKVALAVFDVCGAPALTFNLEQKGNTVVVLGAGKAGLLAAYAAHKKMGRQGKVFLLDAQEEAIASLRHFSFLHGAEKVNAQDPQAVCEVVSRLTQTQMADLVINCTPVSGTEAASILAAKPAGTVLFFNMATRFQTAVLTAEGLGHETRLIMGNGYYPHHAEFALNLLHESLELRNWFEKKFGSV